NHRFLELSSKIPPILFEHEDDVRKIIQKNIRRGKVYLSVMSPDAVGTGKVVVNETLAQEYYKAFKKIKKNLKLNDPITLENIIRLPDVMTHTSTVAEKNKIWDAAKKAISKALITLDQSKKTEGKNLKADLLKRAALIASCVKSIKRLSVQSVKQFNVKTKARFAKEAKTPAGAEKMNQEMASFAKSTDITEEMVRLESHIKTFQSSLKQGGEIGRKIDFIAQEMMRETNTTGAKCGTVLISEKVIEIKSELEKIREQAQNLE
ncbi:MAG: YicC family protein, partial [Candidatus Omnitrophica bacterium]|nr:YicC family protein [Candidatus Omnitrophota bacterium]